MVSINAGSYSIHVGPGLLGSIGPVLSSRKKCRVLVVSDTNVFPLYGRKVIESLNYAGFECVPEFVFEAGENRKNIDTVNSLLGHASRYEMTRTDLFAALGGGVVGDITGFASAIWLRGTGFIQIPTTLLAAVDASVGGKTGVDTSFGKNLIGAFHEPVSVITDTSVLSTLPDRQYSCGMAEVIKTAVIGIPELFGELSGKYDDENIITSCIKLKSDIVKRDLYDNGERRLLNLGHTFGHAVEYLSGYSVTHGEAVASGLYFISCLSASLGICDDSLPMNIYELLTHHDLNPELVFDAAYRDTDFLISAVLRDKKRSGDCISLVLPQKIGNCAVRDFKTDELPSLISEAITWKQR